MEAVDGGYTYCVLLWSVCLLARGKTELCDADGRQSLFLHLGSHLAPARAARTRRVQRRTDPSSRRCLRHCAASARAWRRLRHTVWADRAEAKEHQLRHKPRFLLFAYALDLFASFSVFVASILTLDTLFSVLIAVASVLVYYFGLHVTMSLNFGILSTGVVFRSRFHRQVFARREAALRAIVSIRAFAPASSPPTARGTGRPTAVRRSRQRTCCRAPPARVHVRRHRDLLPAAARRHARFYTACGGGESNELQLASKSNRGASSARPAGSSSPRRRSRSRALWRVLAHVAVRAEARRAVGVRAIKEYRTSTRCARLHASTYWLPTLFAPYFLHVALTASDTWPGHGHEASRVAFACVVSATVSAMLAGLFSVELSLENPFSPSLDAVRVHHELTLARQALRRADTDAKNPGAWQEELNSDDDDDDNNAPPRKATPRWTMTPAAQA